MRVSAPRPPFVLLLVAALVLPEGPAAAASRRKQKSSDTDPPEILIEPVLKAELHTPIVLDAELVDPSGIFEPRLYYRPIGVSQYRSVELVRIADSNRYRGEIPGSAVAGPLEYYLEAFDNEGNGPTRTAQPARPHKLFVATGEPVDDLPALAEPPKPPEGSFESELPAPPPPPTNPTPPTSTAPAAPHAGPEILHEPVLRAPVGRGIAIEASFRGPHGVFYPVVFFRRAGNPGFTSLGMAELPSSVAQPPAIAGVILGPGGTGRFVAEIPAAFAAGDLEYYIEALDSQGNGPSRFASKESPNRVATFRPDEARVDPVVALANCREVPRDGDVIDFNRLGPCRQVPRDVPLESVAKYGLGELKLKYENFPDAFAAFNEVVEQAPLWPAAWFRLAQAAEGAREWTRAKSAYRRYVELTGRPPEYEALLQRIANVDYAIDQAARDEEEAAQKAAEEKAKEQFRARELAAREAARQETYDRERLLSAPGQWGFFSIAADSFTKGEGGDGISDAEAQFAVMLKGRLKLPAVPFLYASVAVSLALSGSPGLFDATRIRLSVLPALGLNLLAIPPPSQARFSLLSPFVAYQPRIQLEATGTLQTHGGVMHSLLVGNHFEFGDTGVEVALAFGLGGTKQFGLELSLGRRLDSP